MRVRMKGWAAVCLAAQLTAHSAQNGDGFRKVHLDDFYRATPLAAKVDIEDLGEKVDLRWDVADGGRGGFTSFGGAQDIGVADGALSFTAGAEPVELGWGNWDGKQPADERVAIADGRRIVIEMRVRQTGAESQWKLTLRAAGQTGGRRGPRSGDTQTLRGSEWQTLSFNVDMPGGDGFSLVVTGPEGNRIAIDDVRFKQRFWRGYFRKEFSIPDGAKVWRAIIAAPPSTADIHVNGKPLAWTVTEEYTPDCLAFSREITDLLTSGVNSIAYELRPDCLSADPLVYFQGKVVLTTGETIVLDSDRTWRSPGRVPDAGWRMSGFDDTSWPQAQESWIQAGKRGRIKRFTGSLRSLIRRPEWPLPAYDGLLVYEHPENRRLYYRDDRPAVLHVRAPAGLAERQPELAWTLRVVGGPYHMTETVVKEGTTSRFARQGDSIVFALDFGRLSQAVHTVETELKAGPETIDLHYREPLLVVGRLPMSETSGTFYEDGLKLEQEDVIDFTNPGDPHRSIEVHQALHGAGKKPTLLETPRIVRRSNMVYRELQKKRSVLAVECTLQHPGDWYLMVLEYPDDAWRGLAVTVSNADTAPKDKSYMIAPAYAIGSASVVTGGKFPLSDTLKELKFMARADTGRTCVEVWNWLPGGGHAAVARLRIYHIKNQMLPALKVERSGERFMGQIPESLRWGRMLFGNNSPGIYYLRWYVDVPGSRIYRLACNYDSAIHLTEYLRFCGLNFHTLGAYQYSERNNSYSLPQRVACSQIPVDINDVALRVFEANGIASLNLIEFWENRGMSARYFKSASQVAAGADTLKQVMANGQQTGIANFLHPRVEELFLAIADDLAFQFSDSSAWKGIATLPYTHPVGLGPGFMSPLNAPLDVCYSDASMARFEKETGIRVPAEGPQRFVDRAEFLAAPEMRAKWIAWRCEKQRDIVLKTRDVLQRYRDDAWTIQVNYISPARIGQWLAGEGSYHEMNRLYGFDAALYKGLDHVWYGRCVYTDADCSLAKDAHRVSEEAAADYDVARRRMAFIRTAWYEDELLIPKEIEWPYARLEVTQYPRYGGDFCKEDFTQAMIGTDPELILSGWADCGGEQTGQEQRIREVARVVTALPRERLPLVLGTGFDANLAVRAGRSKGRYWIYAANPGFWHVKGDLVLRGAREIYEAAGREKIQGRRQAGAVRIPLDLGPFGMQAFVADPEEAEVVEFVMADPAEKESGFLRTSVDDAYALLEAPDKVAAFSAGEVACIAKTARAAASDVTDGKYAAAWSKLQGYEFRHIVSSGDYRAGLSAGQEYRMRPGLDAVPAGALQDGDKVFDPAFWREIPGSHDFKPVSRQLVPLPGRPAAQSEVKASYDDTCLYVAFACADHDVTSLQARAVTPPELFALYDDCIDVFIAPASSSAARVYQFALNPSGRPRLAVLHGTTRRGVRLEQEWQSRVIIGQDRWTAIFAVPFSTLNEKPEPGDTWRINFRRRYRQFALPESVWSLVVSSYTGDTDKFGALIFL